MVLSSRNTEKLNRLAKELSDQYQVITDVIPLDLGKNETITGAVEQFKSRHQKIDILVNNGGISQRSLLIETPVEVDRKVLEVNFFGTITLTKGILPMMIEAGGGHIVVMSSVVGKFGMTLRSAYSASKHAQIGRASCRERG